MLPAEWTERYPVLGDLEPAVRKRIAASAAPVEVPAGTALFHPGSTCKGYGLLLSGTVRVQITGDSGREIVLYRVRPGETCIQTAVCLLSGDHYSAEGVAETDVAAAVIDPATFEQLLDESPAFRRFVFASFGARLGDMMRLVERVRFVSFERRLAGFLLANADDGGRVALTHQQIATELGTAREVVSRHLKALAETGVVRLGRGQVEVLEPRALEDRAAAEHAA